MGKPVGLALPVLIVGAMLTGLAPIFVRLAVGEGAGAEAAAFWRFVFSLPVLAAWAMLERGGVAGAATRRATRRTYWLVLLAGLFFASDLATWHAGIVRTDVANATLLVNLTPVLVGAAAWLIFRERPAGRFIAGGVAALAGAMLLSGAGFSAAEEAQRGTRALGDALSALTAVWYAAYMLVVKSARARLGTGRVMFWSSLVGAAVLGAALLALGVEIAPPTALAFLWLGLLGALTHAGGQGAIAFALGRLPAGFAALMILVQPIVAAAAAWVLFGEALGPLQLLGGAVVLAGLWFAARPRTDAAVPALT